MNLKVLYITDIHIKGATPTGRTDIYYISIFNKLSEIREVIRKSNIDFVIIGGDLFDIPSVSNRLYSMTAKMFYSWKVKIFVIPGNHDVFGQNIESLQHTSLGALESAGLIKIVTRDFSPMLLGKKSEPGNILALYGQEYYDGIDTGVNGDYDIDLPRSDAFNLLVVHGFAIDKPFMQEIPHTVINTIFSSADLILTGHYHPNTYDLLTSNNVRLLKPTSFGRLEATKHNINVPPQYLILEFENNKLKNYKFENVKCALNGVDIFEKKYLLNAEHKNNKITLESFKNNIVNTNIDEHLSTREMLKVLAQNNPDINQEHISKATYYLSESEKNISDKELNGFIPINKEINIIEVGLMNFQSHIDTVIGLDRTSLNAFIGSSHSGKSAIIRAVKWVLYNEPKGNDMIYQGKTKCSVYLRLDNGIKITRYRTKSSTGGYKILDENTGVETEYTKFSNNIPVEVFNAHQMPKILIGKERVSINFGMQLDGPFMISNTGSERANFIGNITGADVIDEATAVAGTNIANLQRDISEYDKELDSLSSKLSNFDDLATQKEELLYLENLILEIKNLTDKNNALNNIYLNLSNIDSNILSATNILSTIPNLDLINELIVTLDELLLSNINLNSLFTQYNSNLKTYDEYRGKLEKIGDISSVVDIINIIDEQHSKLSLINSTHKLSIDINDNYKKAVTKINSIVDCSDLVAAIEIEFSKFSKYESLNIVSQNISTLENSITIPNLCDFDIIRDSYNEYISVAELLNKQSKIQEDKKLLTSKLDDINSKINTSTLAYRDKLKKVGKCPICNSILKGNVLDNITF